MRKFDARELSVAGLIAGLYTLLSVVFLPISFGVYQVRIAEALTVLPFLTRAAIPGLYIGCLLANVIGGMGWLDIIFGPIITLIAALLTYFVRRLTGRVVRTLLPVIPIACMWAGAIYFLSEFEMTISTALGTVLSPIGLVLMAIGEAKGRGEMGSRRVRAAMWVVSSAITLLAIILLIATDDVYFIVFGALLLAAALLLTMLLTRYLGRQSDANVLIAPLPPVVLNALGVSAYLAPLLGFNYWFSVQMIGVGELIACYLLGLPLVLALRNRRLFTQE